MRKINIFMENFWNYLNDNYFMYNLQDNFNEKITQLIVYINKYLIFAFSTQKFQIRELILI